MMVLADLDAFMIRASHVSNQQSSRWGISGLLLPLHHLSHQLLPCEFHYRQSEIFMEHGRLELAHKLDVVIVGRLQQGRQADLPLEGEGPESWDPH